MNRKLLAVLALALLVRLAAFSGYVGQPDEITNVEIVEEILEGSWPRYEDRILEMIFPTRIGYVGVQAALVGLLGVSDGSFTLYSLLSSLGTVWVAFLLGRLWLGERGGLWASLLMAFFPLDIIFATKISGDPSLSFHCALSVLFFFRAREARSRRTAALNGFLAGCVVGFAYLHKVTAGYTAVFFAVVGLADMIRNRRVMVRYLALGLGFALLFLVEMGFQSRVNQDPLYRWKVLGKQSESQELRAGLHAEERLNGWKDDVKRVCWTFPVRSLFSLRLGFHFWFVFPAVVYGLLFRRKDLWGPLLWWGLLALLLNLSTLGGVRLPFYARQVYPIIVPGVILVAALFLRIENAQALRSPGFRKALLLLSAAAALLCLAVGVGLSAYQERLIPFVARLYASADRVVVSDEIVAWFLSFSFRYAIASAFATAAFLAAVFAAGRFRERAGSRTWAGTALAAVLAGFLALTSVSCAYMVNRGMPNFRLEKDAWRVLADAPPGTVYADWYTKKMLDFYMGFPDPSRVVEFRDADLDRLRDGYLVYNAFRRDLEKRFRSVAGDYRKDDPYLYSYEGVDAAIREDWEAAARVRGGQILIYRIP